MRSKFSVDMDIKGMWLYKGLINHTTVKCKTGDAGSAC